MWWFWCLKCSGRSFTKTPLYKGFFKKKLRWWNGRVNFDAWQVLCLWLSRCLCSLVMSEYSMGPCTSMQRETAERILSCSHLTLLTFCFRPLKVLFTSMLAERFWKILISSQEPTAATPQYTVFPIWALRIEWRASFSVKLPNTSTWWDIS